MEMIGFAKIRNTVLLGVLLVLAAAPQAGAHPPAVIDLGTLGGDSFAIGIAPHGRIVVGESTNPGGQMRPVAWFHRRIVDLDTPIAPGEADGLDVNDAGTIVGTYGQTEHPAVTQHGFTWRLGHLTILPGLPGGAGTYARRINQSGEIAGSAFTPDGVEHPVVWVNDQIHELSLPAPYTSGYLITLNDQGDLGGSMFTADGNGVTFTWHQEHFRILSTLGGPTAQINVLDDRGIAAGIADLSRDRSEATIWDRDGRARALGFFPGGDFSWVLGTDGRGDYTGIADLSPTDPNEHVFVARDHGPLLTLPPLAGSVPDTNTVAHGFDLSGDVAGASETPSGKARATLWMDAFAQAFIPSSIAATSVTAHYQRAPHLAFWSGARSLWAIEAAPESAGR
jgi:uncharacterized membrane protein